MGFERRWEGRGWTLSVTGEEVRWNTDGRPEQAASLDQRPQLRRHWWRWFLQVEDRRVLRLHGMDASLASTVNRTLARAALQSQVDKAVGWKERWDATLHRARREQRWLPRSAVARLVETRPSAEIIDQIEALGLEAPLTAGEADALEALRADVDQVVGELNRQIVQAELVEHADFFSSIESSPLTEEQARAVIAYDNATQLLAAAGSGKTSVMVARAAYAVMRGFTTPERVLLLAFNKAAAQELQERVEARFAAAGLDASGVRASTFHAFGLWLVGTAEGAKPGLADWVSDGREVRKVLEIVERLCARDRGFAHDWGMYRALYARISEDMAAEEPDARDGDRSGFLTFKGDVVKSHGERMIADWLYLHHVDYEYERPFAEEDTGSETHRQYRPDFYYPDIDAYHEHWALGRDGRPPAEFADYAKGMEWKRQLHARCGTDLVETTWAGVVWGDGLAQLEQALASRGMTPRFDPNRPPQSEWAGPVDAKRVARLIRTFMSHVKANGLNQSDVDARVGQTAGAPSTRSAMFLRIYWAVHHEWQRELAAAGAVDYDDMLASAAAHLESGRVTPDVDLVLADEFQDASQTRARIVRALLRRPGTYLLAVGDDWQAINRFAGADLAVMSRFTDWFGPGPQLALTTTFRCTQTICEVARRFVAKNADQFDKQMRSHLGPGGHAVVVAATADTRRTLTQLFERLAADVRSGALRPSGDALTVDVLGRYRKLQQDVPPRIPDGLKVTFRTMHAAKGLEADIVVVIGAVSGTFGFPSAIEDDPVLTAAMPSPEAFPHAEERRLFYVALTRARQRAYVLTREDRPSPFVTELATDGRDGSVKTVGFAQEKPRACPGCAKGTLRPRTGKFGGFFGCTRYPACNYTEDDPEHRESRSSPRQAPARLCDRCGTGRLVQRKGPRGRFLGCTSYPVCRNTASL